MNFKQYLSVDEGSISNNIKTDKSVDFTTNCPKRREGKACKYCYVEASRNNKFQAKKVIEHQPYKGEVIQNRKD